MSVKSLEATLTHRVHLDDPPVVIPASGWAYNATGTAIRLVSSTGATTNFVANDIYEFSYTAKDPVREWFRLRGQPGLERLAAV